MKLKAVLTIAIILLVGCGTAFGQDKKEKKEDKKETVIYEVSMTCEKCKKRIESNIAYEKGVSDMKVNLPDKTVTVVYRKDKTSPDKLRKAFEKLGYTATVKEDSEPEKE